MTGFVSSFSTIWRLAIPYFRSEDRWPGRILLAAVIAIELSLVGITVLLTYWYNSFYNALQEPELGCLRQPADLLLRPCERRHGARRSTSSI